MNEVAAPPSIEFGYRVIVEAEAGSASSCEGAACLGAGADYRGSMASHALDAALFDMDGTLVDSTQVVESVWRQFSLSHGVPFGELIHYAHGRQTHDTVDHFLPDLSVAARSEITAALERQEVEDTDGIREIPGASRVVREMLALDVPLGIVTSASRTLATRRLQAAGIPAVSLLICAEDTTEGKPSPVGYRQAMRHLSATPQRTFVFEDAPAGIQAAAGSGAEVVVVGGEGTERGARLFIPDFTSVFVRRGRGQFHLDGLLAS